MYTTPIFYPEAIVPQKFHFVLDINPFYYFLTLFRGALYLDISLMYRELLYGFLFSVGALAAGWFFYNRYKDRVVYYL